MINISGNFGYKQLNANTAKLGGVTYDVSWLLSMYSAKEIETGFQAFIDTNPKFNNIIKNILYRRLKVATGELLNSLKWIARVKIDKKKGGSFLSVYVYLSNIKKLQALLGSDELKSIGLNNIPALSELEKYVIAKREIFNQRIQDMKKQDDIRNLMLQSRQSQLVYNNNNSSKKNKQIHKTSNDYVIDIASGIRNAMIKRLESGKSANKGSEYTLLGYHKLEKDNHSTVWTPVYRRETDPKYDMMSKTKLSELGLKYKPLFPIYSVNGDWGELNIAIKDAFIYYINNILITSTNEHDIFKKKLSGLGAKELADVLINHYPQMIEDRNHAISFSKTFQQLLDLGNIIAERFAGSGRKNINRTIWGEHQKRQIDAMEKMASANLKYIEQSAKYKLGILDANANYVLRNIDRMSQNIYQKRAAIRRKRRLRRI